MVKRVILCGAGVVGLSLVLGNAWSLSAAPRQDARSVHVAVVTNEGIPVTDLTAADFEVKEGGKATTITSAAITNVPLRVALIVADEGDRQLPAGDGHVDQAAGRARASSSSSRS